MGSKESRHLIFISSFAKNPSYLANIRAGCTVNDDIDGLLEGADNKLS